MLAKKYKTPAGLLFILLALVFAGLGNIPPAAAEPLDIVGGDRQLTVQIELADTAVKRRVGLMARTELAPLSGMLFDFKTDQMVYMWMKNTLIPLDMIFADHTGRIVYIKEQAQPGDLSIVGANVPVLAVLEMAGGFVARHKVQVGDLLVHGLFEE